MRETVRALSSVIPNFRKQAREENRRLGEEIISKAEPKPLAVGSGRGAEPTVRAAASATMVAIRAGGAHRSKPVQQWGAKFAPREGPRPFILGAAEKAMPDIEERYLDAIVDAAERAGLEAHD